MAHILIVAHLTLHRNTHQTFEHGSAVLWKESECIKYLYQGYLDTNHMSILHIYSKGTSIMLKIANISMSLYYQPNGP